MTDEKPMPGQLHPDVGRLAGELRRLRERSGLSLTALAQQTLYSRSAWDRYLNGKAMPPRQAVIRLGEIAGAEPERLMVMWEYAITAWRDQGTDATRTGHDPASAGQDTPAAPGIERAGNTARTDHEPEPATMSSAHSAHLAKARSRRFPAVFTGGRPVAVILAGLLLFGGMGALVTTSQGAFAPAGTASTSHQATDSPNAELQTNCYGDTCTGKDPRQTGCAGDAWTAALTRVQQVYVELRYSNTCRTAWARISWGRPGDIAQVTGSHGHTFRNIVHYDTDVFTAMAAAPTPSDARACTTLTTSDHGCTEPGGTEHLTEPPEPPAPTSPAEAAN